ncbi:MAG: pilus assembly protein TadG-related protein [Nocardioidaceae bacterium]
MTARTERGRGRPRSQRGQASVLVVGVFVVALMMVGVVVDASAAYLRRTGLDAVADGAALAATEAVEGSQVYESRLGERARLDATQVRARVAAYLAAVQAARRYPGFRYAVTIGADRVVVRVAAPLELPITPPGWERRPVITGIAAAYVLVSE